MVSDSDDTQHPTPPNDDAEDLAHVLAWAEEGLGANTLAYILGIRLAELTAALSGDLKLAGTSQELARQIGLLRFALPQELDETAKREVLPAWIMQVNDSGRSIATAMRGFAAGLPILPETRDTLEALLVTLALDSYPGLLLPPDPRYPPQLNHVRIHVTRMLYAHPATKEFNAQVLKDSTLKRLFVEESEHTGYTGHVYRNTGTGGSIQLWTFASQIIERAWSRLPGASCEDFLSRVLLRFRTVRGALAGHGQTIRVVRAFTGVLLPPGTNIQLGRARLRETTEEDRQFAPDALKQTLTGTSQENVTTVVNYDGDVILEFDMPFKTRIGELQLDDAHPWPDELLPHEDFERLAGLLRFAIVIAAPRADRAQVVPTWHYFEDPFSSTADVGWSDPRKTGLMPTQLTVEELDGVKEWYDLLDTPSAKKINLAITRALRAISERGEPSDVLIDAVIAWENLFGTKEGEPTLRVTACLARLLADTFGARKELRAKLSKIYALRSKVVHGSANLGRSDYPLCFEAASIAIEAIGRLVSSRRDILDSGDGAARSLTLLLEDGGQRGIGPVADGGFEPS